MLLLWLLLTPLTRCFVDNTFVVLDEDVEVLSTAGTSASVDSSSTTEFTADSTAGRRSVAADNDAGDGPCKATGLPSLS